MTVNATLYQLHLSSGPMPKILHDSVLCIYLQENLNKYAQTGSKFELFQESCKCTLDIILKCAFSFDVDVQRQG